MDVLSAEQVEQFIADGFVRVEEAFARSLVGPCLSRLEAELLARGIDVNDSRTWRRPVVRLGHFDDPPFCEAANSAQLLGAWDQLVGAGRWYPRPGLGTFPVRFPSEQDPGDAGWHFDSSFSAGGEWRVNVRSRGRGLLMLFLFSDITADDAPTRLRVGSHLLVPPLLRPFGDEGVADDGIDGQLLPLLESLPITLATGSAGDVWLCHPFLVHAAGWPHRGSAPRYIAQPPLALKEPLDLDAAEPTPVEAAVQRSLAGTGV